MNPTLNLHNFIERAIGALIVVALLFAMLFNLPAARAAVTNVSPATGQVVVIPLHFSGTYSATTTAAAKFNMPFACKLLGAGAVPRALTGTGNTVDVLLGGTTVLSAAMAMTAGTYTEGTITTSSITDEGVITVNLTIPSGTLVDTTVLLTCLRR